MWADTARTLADGATSPTTPLAVILALITAITAFVVAIGGLVAAGAKFVESYRTRRQATPTAPPVPLNSDDDDDPWTPPADYDGAVRMLRLTRRRNKALELILIRAGFVPSRVETGEEPLTNVRI